jgi:glutamyl-tRNA reductase
MALGFLGTDYQRAPLETLEKFSFTPEAAAKLKSDLNSQSWITESIVLSTCNRVELYFVTENIQAASQWLTAYLAKTRKLSISETSRLHYYHGQDALHHLLRVVAGIESMVFGENEILTQAKNALTQAQDLRSSGAFLNKLFQVAIACGKRIRKETQISRGAYSISSIAVDCIRERFPNFLECKILIIGAGTIGMRAIKKLHALNHPDVHIANRSEEKLDRLCEHYNLGKVSFESLEKSLSSFNVIVVATGSESYIVTAQNLKSPGTDTLLIDLSMPRNIDPELAKHPNIHLVPIDGLKEIAQKNMATRKKELAKIQVIIEEEMDEFNEWLAYRDKLSCPA